MLIFNNLIDSFVTDIFNFKKEGHETKVKKEIMK